MTDVPRFFFSPAPVVNRFLPCRDHFYFQKKWSTELRNTGFCETHRSERFFLVSFSMNIWRDKQMGGAGKVTTISTTAACLALHLLIVVDSLSFRKELS